MDKDKYKTNRGIVGSNIRPTIHSDYFNDAITQTFSLFRNNVQQRRLEKIRSWKLVTYRQRQ